MLCHVLLVLLLGSLTWGCTPRQPAPTPSPSPTILLMRPPDAQVDAAIGLLALVLPDDPVVATLRTGVGIAWAADDQSDAPWGEYQALPNRILLAPSLRQVERATLATVLAHEGVHALAMADGARARREASDGAAEGCYAEELEATETGLRVWLSLHGPQGKAAPQHPAEAEFNRQLQQWRADPESLARAVRAGYAGLCEGAHALE